MSKVFNLIIVDESGSMSCIRQQAVAGIAETISTIQYAQKQTPELEQRITLLSFNSLHTRFHLDNVSPDKLPNLSPKAYDPNGCTPLYDAIGRGINHVFPFVGADDKVLVTIITDGMENSSTEFTLTMVKALIEKLKTQGWTFSLIGADSLDVGAMAKEFSISACMSWSQDDEGTKEMFEKERCAREAYYCKLSKGESIDDSKFFEG